MFDNFDKKLCCPEHPLDIDIFNFFNYDELGQLVQLNVYLNGSIIDLFSQYSLEKCIALI